MPPREIKVLIAKCRAGPPFLTIIFSELTKLEAVACLACVSTISLEDILLIAS